MKICIASDHRGFELKEKLLKYLNNKYNIEDLGTHSSEMVDYTKYAFLVGEKVRDKEYDFGIVICGTGIGISIACNKVKNIRCAKVNSVDDAIMTRKDNDANVIALDGKLDENNAIEIIEAFLNTEFSNIERYQKRIHDIELYERGEYVE